MSTTVQMIVERDQAGEYVGHVPSLPGCTARAGSREELREAIRESLARWGEPLEFVGMETLDVDAEP